MSQNFPAIECAALDWQHVDGVDIPFSRQFGDVYFSRANGLLETRHVFLEGNELSSRLAQLQAHEYFVVGETGFGTGLNFLALWQLWHSVRPDNHSHLHFISVEKFPLSLADLKKALAVWTELQPFTEQLIESYPLPMNGCHRLTFPAARISVDLWLGDAADSFPMIESLHPVNAWFLDGFAPSCNPELWQEQIFKHIMRLSAQGTTFSSFSVAGVLKNALRAHGVSITRPKGFGEKRQMLKAVWQQQAPERTQHPIVHHLHIIGAGIAGLNCAWAAAQRGITVTLYDQDAPLAGGSGNPVAFLNPKLGHISQAPIHLMTVCWQYALDFYKNFNAFKSVDVQQIHEKDLDTIAALATDYPSDLLSYQQINSTQGQLTLHHAGRLLPHLFAKQVLAHPLIEFQQLEITALEYQNNQWRLKHSTGEVLAQQVICCNARQFNQLCPDAPLLKAIRGQVSWSQVKIPFTAKQMHQGYSYGGYALALDSEQLIFGASFLPKDDQTEIRLDDHLHNLNLLQQYLPHLAEQLADEPSQWQGRAAIRAQTADYFPLLGQVNSNTQGLYCFTGLGSKGFLFAPLCSELLISQICQQMLPMPKFLVDKLKPQRFRKKPQR